MYHVWEGSQSVQSLPVQNKLDDTEEASNWFAQVHLGKAISGVHLHTVHEMYHI